MSHRRQTGGLARVALVFCAALVFPAWVHAQSPVAVQVRPVSEILIAVERRAPAEVRSLNAATLSAEVSAVVSAIHADTGQHVRKGDLLLELNAADYALALNQAEASLAAAKAQRAQADARLKRAQELGANQYLSADELLARETDVMVVAAQIRVHEANVAVARRNLEKCRVLAAFDGSVGERFAQLGAYVTPGTPLLELTQTDRFELEAEVPDELGGSLEAAETLWFASRNENWPVRLVRLSSVIDSERRSRRARFEFIGEDGASYAEAAAVGRSGELVWRDDKGLLPANVIVRRDGQLGVFVNEDRVAVFKPLPGAQEGRPAASNLPLDVEVVIEGRDRLQDGDPIAPAR